MNLFGLVSYFNEIIGSSQGQLLVVDRRKLQALVTAAKKLPRYSRERSTYRRFNALSGAQRSELSRSALDEPSSPHPSPERAEGATAGEVEPQAPAVEEAQAALSALIANGLVQTPEGAAAAALSPPAAEGKEEACGIYPPRHDPLCVSATPCLLPDGHDGPHACETRDGRRSWQSDDDCDCCDVTDPDRCITWSPAPAAEPVEALKLLASIWFYGGFRAETRNERQLQAIMEQHGFWPMASEADLIALLDASPPEPVAISREEIAREIDPGAWAEKDWLDTSEFKGGYSAGLSARLDRSRRKADAILAKMKPNLKEEGGLSQSQPCADRGPNPVLTETPRSGGGEG